MKNILKEALILTIALIISGAFGFISINYAQATTGPVSVSLSANSLNVNKSEKTTLSWNSTNADGCVAHSNVQSPWFGVRAVSGNETINPTQTATYFITCGNNGGNSGTAQITITVGEGSASAVSVNISANPESIFRGEWTTLIWSSTNAVSCETAGGAWAGMKQTYGSETVSPSITTYYTLRCNNSQGEYSSDTQVIFVNQSPPSTPTPTATITPAPIPATPTPTIKPVVPRITKLSAPTNLKPNYEELPSGTEEVVLSWDEVKGAKFYAVRMEPVGGTDERDERNNCPENPHKLCVNNLDSTSIKVKVGAGIDYNWWVHAADANGVFGGPAFAKFSIKAEEVGTAGNFFANIFSGVGGIVLALGLIILTFIIGYTIGKSRKEKSEYPYEPRIKPFESLK